jgi:poly-gamma-glutamate synthesis protein (capsule biosynthesis protein)
MTVVGSGDTIIARRIVPPHEGPERDLIRLIGSADVAFTNLEIPLSGFLGRKGDWFVMSADPAIAGDLRQVGFDLVSFANNHALNYGEEGMSLTLQALAEAGIGVAGAGANLHEARRPAYVDVPAGRAALLAATSTFLPGEQATHSTRDQAGRGGLNPLRHEATYVVDEQALAELQRIGRITRLGGRRAGLLRRPIVDPARRPPVPEAYEFSGSRFGAGPDPGRVISRLDAEDLTEILRWVNEARQYADVVLVSIHSHEAGVETADKTTPPEFIVDFAHACIDAGADAIFGHGPHRLMGLDIYRGKPIFYSLGNLFWQVEYVMSLLGENYVGPDMRDLTPYEFHSRFIREQQIRDDQAQWDTVVPECVFDDHVLRKITLHPVTLGWREPLPRRGTPRMATGDDAARILRSFAALSAGFGTTVEVDGDRALVHGEPAAS